MQILALLLAILSLALALVAFNLILTLACLGCSLLAIVLGAMARKKAARIVASGQPKPPTGKAMTAIVLGVIAVILGIALHIIYIQYIQVLIPTLREKWKWFDQKYQEWTKKPEKSDQTGDPKKGSGGPSLKDQPKSGLADDLDKPQ